MSLARSKMFHSESNLCELTKLEGRRRYWRGVSAADGDEEDEDEDDDNEKKGEAREKRTRRFAVGSDGSANGESDFPAQGEGDPDDEGKREAGENKRRTLAVAPSSESPPRMSHSFSVLSLTSTPVAERSTAAKAARELRNRAASFGHKGRSFHQEDESPVLRKSLDLEEATMFRLSSGDLRDPQPKLVRSLSDGKLDSVLDDFLQLDRDLRDAKTDTDEATNQVRMALASLAETPENLKQQADEVCEKLLHLGPVELKAGGLKPIVTEIQQLQKMTEAESQFRMLLTKLLLSIAKVTRVIRQFEMAPVVCTSSPVLLPALEGRRHSVSSLLSSGGDQSPTLDSAYIKPAEPQLNLEDNSEEKRNVYIETNVEGIIQYISPFAKEVLGANPSLVINKDFRHFMASKKDEEIFDKSLQALCANPSDIIEIKCYVTFSEDGIFITGKGMLVNEYGMDTPTRVIWVFRVGSDFEEEEGDERTPDTLSCHICGLEILSTKFDEHAVYCGDLLHSENAVTIADEKLNEIRVMVAHYALSKPTNYITSRFLKRIDKALQLSPDDITIEEAATGKLKSPILIWSKSFPKKALKDQSDLQKIGQITQAAIKEKTASVIYLKNALRKLDGDNDNNPLSPSAMGLAFDLPIEYPITTTSSINPSSPKKSKLSRRKSVISTTTASIDDFEIIKPVSKGAFGKVFLAKRKYSSFYYAIKILKKDEMIRKNQVDNIKQERKILSRTNSPFLVKLYYSFQSTNNLYLVQEYCNGGDCAAMLKLVGYLDEKWAVSYIAEVVLALEYLHGEGIVHRDLKPDNLLIDSTGHIKLTDFGLSKVGFLKRQDLRKKSMVPPGDESPRTKMDSKRPAVGTPDYLAPEVIVGVGELGSEVDWWALGVIFYQFLYGFPPFNAETPEEIFENILNRSIRWTNEENPISPEALHAIDSLLNMIPENRLGSKGAKEVKAHPVFQSLDWNKLLDTQPTFVPRTEGIEDTAYFDSRGLTLKDLEAELLEPSSTPDSSSPKSGSGSHSSRKSSLSPKHSDFEDFAFKNADHLREQNEVDMLRFRRRGSTSGYSPLMVALSSSPLSNPSSPTLKPRQNSLPSDTVLSKTEPKRVVNFTDKNVLIANGNIITSKVLETIMKRSGLRCSVADDAATAVMLATSSNIHFNAIFIDKDLPDGGADRAAALIKAVKGPNKNTPIICTAYEKNFVLAKSFDDVLIKPFSKSDVDDKLNFWTTN